MAKAPSTYASSVTPSSVAIVFFRDSGVAYAVNFAILDQAANFLGDAVARSDFSVQVPSGRYFLIAKGGDGTDAVQAEVVAGHVYYVRVIPRMGMWLAGVELDPIKPGEREWPQLSKWLTQTNHLTPVVPKVPVDLSASPLPEWAAKAWGERCAPDCCRCPSVAEPARAPLRGFRLRSPWVRARVEARGSRRARAKNDAAHRRASAASRPARRRRRSVVERA